MKFSYSPPLNAPIKSEDLLLDLKKVSKRLKNIKLSQEIYNNHGKYSSTCIKRRFGTWNKALSSAGLEQSKIAMHSLQDLFGNILNVWQRKGIQPRQGDMDSNLSTISSSVYKRRFGTWSNAVKEFIKYANGKEIKVVQEEINAIGFNKQTKREPNLSLRYRILLRDNFRCVKCGRSPANHPNIKLQIDHIKPWKGPGETEFSNLQTLCEECNLGKSNRL